MKRRLLEKTTYKCEIRAATEKGILLFVLGEEHWFPLKHVWGLLPDEIKAGNTVEAGIEDWLMRRKGLMEPSYSACDPGRNADAELLEVTPDFGWFALDAHTAGKDWR